MDLPNFWVALGLTLFAGLSTGLGSLIAFGARRASYRFLSVSTGFSAGVMLYVSFMEILPKAEGALGEALGPASGSWWAIGAFFLGILLIIVAGFVILNNLHAHVVNRRHDVFNLFGRHLILRQCRI
jgi:ZIP family zinc transporter